MTDPDLRHVFLDYLGAINARRLDRLPEFVHERITFNGTGVDLADYVAAIEGHLAAVRDFVWTVEDLLVEDDRIAVRLTDTGTPVQEWLGLAPTGASISATEYAFYHFRDGRIEHMWYLLDSASIGAQLG